MHRETCPLETVKGKSILCELRTQGDERRNAVIVATTRVDRALGLDGLTPVDEARQAARHANGELHVRADRRRWHCELKFDSPQHRQQ